MIEQGFATEVKDEGWFRGPKDVIVARQNGFCQGNIGH